MSASDVLDPFCSYDMQDLLTMDEGQWRQYIVHTNTVTSGKLTAIERMLKRRPEVVRANVALLVSVVMAVCGVVSLVWAVVG